MYIGNKYSFRDLNFKVSRNLSREINYTLENMCLFLLFFNILKSATDQKIEDSYFFEVNTKYISSNVLKISVISRIHSTSEIADIFNT